MYRRKKDGEKWHWCANCPDWPEDKDSFDEQYNRPDDGKLCKKCTENSNKGNCPLGTSDTR